MSRVLIIFLFFNGYACFPQNKDEKSDTIALLHTDMQPEFPGGFAAFAKFISDSMNPSPPGNCNAHGCRTYKVKFMISNMGEVKDVSILTYINDCPAYENELIRVFKHSPKWKPAIVNNKPVNTYYILPIKPRFP